MAIPEMYQFGDSGATGAVMSEGPKPLFSWRHAILESDLHSTTRHVLLTLSCHMNDLGESCWPSTKRLERETGLSERSVVNHLRKAKEAGWLRVDVLGFGGQRWRHHSYTISVPASGYPDYKAAEVCSAPSGESNTGDPAPSVGESEPVSEGTERYSVPSAESVENLGITSEGAEPHAEGTEPDDKKALNEVQSISSVNSTKNSAVTRARETRSEDDVYVNLTLKSEQLYPVTVAQMTELAHQYPQVDIPTELQRMADWCQRKLEKRKGRDQIEKFINGWLAREQNKHAEAPTTHRATFTRGGHTNPGRVDHHIKNLRRAWGRGQAAGGQDA